MMPTTIEKLCSLGCNVTINYSDYILTSLEKFALIIVKTNGTLTIRRCSKAVSASLEKIASIGKEHVTLDFTE